MTTRQIIERREATILSRRAALSEASGERKAWLSGILTAPGYAKLVCEPSAHTRFADDREKIVNTDAFRKLAGKTQVLIRPTDETVTTRLFHSLQVAQHARTVGRALGLNEDLIEAIALGHDLGHTPFGHAGERALAALSPLFPFEHNRHSLKMVEALYGWMNLSFEVRDGILRHSGPISQVTRRSRRRDNDDLTDSKRNPTTLEGCLVKVMDKVASAAQDYFDLLKAGMIKNNFYENDLHLKKFREICQLLDVGQFVGHPQGWHQVLLADLIENSKGGIRIAFSEGVFNVLKDLKAFVDGVIGGEINEDGKIFEQDPRIKEADAGAERIVAKLFENRFQSYKDNYNPVFNAPFDDLNSPYFIFPGTTDSSTIASNIAEKVIDEIAAMTDRMAIELYENITGKKAPLESLI